MYEGGTLVEGATFVEVFCIVKVMAEVVGAVATVTDLLSLALTGAAVFGCRGGSRGSRTLAVGEASETEVCVGSTAILGGSEIVPS